MPHRLDRWMYRGGRPNRVARFLNGTWRWTAAAGLPPHRMKELQVRGRRTGRLRSFPVVIADYEDGRYREGRVKHVTRVITLLPPCPDSVAHSLKARKKPRLSGAFSDAGGGTRTPDTRIMISDKQGSVRSDSPSQAREGQLSSGESGELGARSGAQARRKRKRRKG
jgi:hypothetical protein